MNAFRPVRIHGRLRRLMMLNGVAAALLSCGALVVLGVVSSTSERVRTLGVLADLAGTNLADALARHDQEAARDTLAPLLGEAGIVAVHVLDSDNRVFVRIGQARESVVNDPVASARKGLDHVGDRMVVSRQIGTGTRPAGIIIVEAEKSAVQRENQRVWLAGVGVFAVSMIVAFAIASGLGRLISEPIRSLADLVNRVQPDADRAPMTRSDDKEELALLADRLKELVELVEQQRRSLAEADSLFEQRVEERVLELHKEIEVRRRSEAQLRRTLNEKEAIVEEIHHRVKNNLQIISSLLNLQARHASDPATRTALNASRDRVRSLALVHEVFSESEKPAQIVLASYLRRISSYLLSVLSPDPLQVHVRVDPSPIRLDIGQAITVGLIVHELVSNSLEHAFPNQRSGKIRISLHTDEDRVKLEVADNGIGIPEDVAWRQPKTLGLQLVQSLADQLDGIATFDQTNGTAFTLDFPLPAASGKA